MVHIGEISFCDKVAFNIKSDDTKKFLLDHLENKYNLKIITKHFEKFYHNQSHNQIQNQSHNQIQNQNHSHNQSDRMMSNLNNNPHMLCVRSNGNPYFLYLTKINFVNYCIFIDKKIQQGYFFPRMIITNFHFDDKLFTDTILDGEMIKKNGEKWVYLVNDLIVYKGVYLKEQNLVKRLNTLYPMLQNEFSPDFMDISRIQVKKYFKYDEILTMLNDYIPSLQYSCRGIYFKPLFLRFKDILVNFDDTLVKKVEREKFKHTNNFLSMNDLSTSKNIIVPEKDKVIIDSKKQVNINELNVSILVNVSNLINVSNDLTKSNEPINVNNDIKPNNTKYQVRKTSNPDVYEMFDSKGIYFDTACIPGLKVSKYMRELFAKKNVVDKIDIDFEFSSKFNKWIPVIIII